MADVVQHGRRKGAVRSPRAEPGVKKEVPANSAEASGVAVLSAEEWQRIKGSLTRREREEEEQTQALERREQRKELSQGIVQKWDNTIEGQRLKRLQVCREREKEEEEERVQIDQAEAEYQAGCRRKAIERARTLLYHHTDRVKHIHGALLLSEVLRERDAQLQNKKKKMEAAETIDQCYIVAEKEERERGIRADRKAAVERAKALEQTARFQVMQSTEIKRLQTLEREAAYAEQKRIDKEVVEFMENQAKQKAEREAGKAILKAELDHVVEEKNAEQLRKAEQSSAEDRSIEIFLKAKKRMTKLRKEKEVELFSQVQTHQERMRQQLAEQRQQELSNEDQRIAKAVIEQEAKTESEEREKEKQFQERTVEIRRHCREMMAEREQKLKEQEKADQELLSQKRAQDMIFHQQQLEKAERGFQEARELQQFQRTQKEEQVTRAREEEEEEKEYRVKNRELMEVEEVQFQQYAGRLMAEVQDRGGQVQPLLHVVQAGPGGGRGPTLAEAGGLRPRFMASESGGVELPSYQPRVKRTPANTQRRLGFTW